MIPMAEIPEFLSPSLNFLSEKAKQVNPRHAISLISVITSNKSNVRKLYGSITDQAMSVSVPMSIPRRTGLSTFGAGLMQLLLMRHDYEPYA